MQPESAPGVVADAGAVVLLDAGVDALSLCRYVNDVTVKMVAQAPTRFSALGAVPLQDPSLARESSRA